MYSYAVQPLIEFWFWINGDLVQGVRQMVSDDLQSRSGLGNNIGTIKRHKTNHSITGFPWISFSHLHFHTHTQFPDLFTSAGSQT
jgi:hypothetical protein